MSFLLIYTTIAIVGEVAKDKSDGWLIALESALFVLEVVLAYVYVDIHRRGVGAIVGFKNFWHFSTVLLVIFMTFQMEYISIANGLSYIQERFVKQDAMAYTKTNSYTDNQRAIKKVDKQLSYWEAYTGTKADKLRLKVLQDRYNNAIKEKEYRLKTYKNATTIKADKAIDTALSEMKQIEDRVQRQKEKNLALYSKVKREFQARNERIKKAHTQKQKGEILTFSKKAEEWAHKVVMFFALVYLVHGLLLVTSEDDFTLRDWLGRLIGKDAAEKVEGEIKRVAEPMEQGRAKKQPVPFSVENSNEELSKTLKRKIVEDAVFSVYRDFWKEYGYSDTKFPHVSRDRARKIIADGISQGIYSKDFSMPNSELGKVVQEANHKAKQVAIMKAKESRAG
jgi:hypothetical protein